MFHLRSNSLNYRRNIWYLVPTLKVIGPHSSDITLNLLDSRQGLGFSLFTTACRSDLGPTQPPFLWVSGVLSTGLMQPGSEADHSPPSSSEIKNAWSYTFTPQYVITLLSTGTILPFPITPRAVIAQSK
jgi:hypothetical protein